MGFESFVCEFASNRFRYEASEIEVAMSKDYFRYDLMMQDAFRGVVRDILNRVVAEGLPGEHHFYIAFNTKVPGVKISQRFHEKYPDEMTIVIQHQYWDLTVSEEKFEIGLSFNNIPEKLVIPFSALTGFMDPSTQFGLQFEQLAANEDSQEETGNEPVSESGSLVPAIGAQREAEEDKPSPAKGKKNAGRAKKAGKKTVAGEKEDADTPATGEIVQLDAFRKKS